MEDRGNRKKKKAVQEDEKNPTIHNKETTYVVFLCAFYLLLLGSTPNSLNLRKFQFNNTMEVKQLISYERPEPPIPGDCKVRKFCYRELSLKSQKNTV